MFNGVNIFIFGLMVGCDKIKNKLSVSIVK